MSMRHPNTEYFYLNAIRNQTIVFMSLFKNMKVVDTTDDADGTLSSSKETDIDIVYAARERKLIEQTYEFLTPDAMYDTKVPRFSVSITSINYDPTRALNFYEGSEFILTLSIIMLTAGFGFKIAAVPFHTWCPDV